MAHLFDPGGVFWAVNREAVLLLTGPRALLLQLAHPLVAAGVAEHSEFPNRALARLRRTLETMLAIVYGEREAALAAARRVNAVHARVRGRLQEETAAFPAGTAYAARDPELARWVHCTLADSALLAYETFVRPLAPEEREAFVTDSNRVAGLLGVPERMHFADAAAFAAYREAMLAGRTLEVTPRAAALADAVLHPPGLPRPLGELGSLASVALLPPRLRMAYALPWGPGRRRIWRALRAGLRTGLPWLPEAFRVLPAARRAERADAEELVPSPPETARETRAGCPASLPRARRR